MIFAANVKEDDLADDGASNAGVDAVREYTARENCEVFVVCAQIEQETAYYGIICGIIGARVYDIIFSWEVFLLYIFEYGLGRFWIEGILTDQPLLPGSGIRVSRLLAAVTVIVNGGTMVWMRLRKRMCT